MSGTQHNNFLSMQKELAREPAPCPDNLSAGRAFSALLSPFPDSVLFALFFRFSALAAPLRRCCSALVLAALSVAVAGAQPAGDWIIETVAGSSLGDGDNGAAVAARLWDPTGVALDGAGNLYFADTRNHRIRKVDAAGVISTVAGDGTYGDSGRGVYGGDGGPATAAQLNFPTGVALDGAGNLYIADRDNLRIRKVDAAGVISTVAGDGTGGYGGDGGPAVAAQLSSPRGVALDGAGNLYIADYFNQRIRKVDAAGTITTVAGSGEVGFDEGGYGGDGGPAMAAQLNLPAGVALDGAGNLYIADLRNDRIRKVDAAGVISTVAGSGTEGFGGDGGPAVAAQLNTPAGVALDGAGNLYFADLRNHRIRKVDAAGVISTVAGAGSTGESGGGFGGDGYPATAAQLNFPSGVALDGSGNLYIADGFNNRIRKVDSAGVISTVAGGGLPGGDGYPATAAQLNFPSGVALDGSGNLYIADTWNGRIRKVDAAGVISTVAGSERFGGFGGDGGPAVAAQLRNPYDVALDGAGNLYIADTSNDRIRKVDTAGVISTVAGNGTEGYGGDGGPATAAQLNSPQSVALDGAGNLYIADRLNHRIRKVDATGVITTVAGDGTVGGRFGAGAYGGDGGPAVAAQLFSPNGMALDGAGNLYIADTGNDRIRKVDAAGVISTVAGSGTEGFGGDGGPAVAAQLNSPSGVALDGAGNLYIADWWNHRIRKVDSAGGDLHGGGRREHRGVRRRLRRGRRPGYGGATALPQWRGAGRSGQPVHRRFRKRSHPPLDAGGHAHAQHLCGRRRAGQRNPAGKPHLAQRAHFRLRTGVRRDADAEPRHRRRRRHCRQPGRYLPADRRQARPAVRSDSGADQRPGSARPGAGRGGVDRHPRLRNGERTAQRSGKRNGRRRLAGLLQLREQPQRAQPGRGAARRGAGLCGNARPASRRRVHARRAGRGRHAVRDRFRGDRTGPGNGRDTVPCGRSGERGLVYLRRHCGSSGGHPVQGRGARPRRGLSVCGAPAVQPPRRQRNRHGHSAGRFHARRTVSHRPPPAVTAQIAALLDKQTARGRSTPGAKLPNDVPEVAAHRNARPWLER